MSYQNQVWSLFRLHVDGSFFSTFQADPVAATPELSEGERSELLKLPLAAALPRVDRDEPDVAAARENAFLRVGVHSRCQIAMPRTFAAVERIAREEGSVLETDLMRGLWRWREPLPCEYDRDRITPNSAVHWTETARVLQMANLIYWQFYGYAVTVAARRPEGVPYLADLARFEFDTLARRVALYRRFAPPGPSAACWSPDRGLRWSRYAELARYAHTVNDDPPAARPCGVVFLYNGERLRVFQVEAETAETLATLDGSVPLMAFQRLRNPRRSQESTLRAILHRHAESEYGRRYGFGQIQSYEEYRTRVPVVRYEELHPSILRMMGGEPDVLIRGVASYFSTTSGSTAVPKFVPGTQQTITAGCEAILARNAYLLRDHPEAFGGQPLFIVGNAAEVTTVAGVSCGAMTGFAYYVGLMGFPGPPFPYGVFTISDYASRYYCILRLALAARHLSVIASYNPSTLLLLFQAARDRWGDLVADIRTGRLAEGLTLPDGLRRELAPFLSADPERASELKALKVAGPRAWWPRLAVLLCWKGGTLGFYLSELRRWIGDLPVRDLGILASEVVMTIPVDDATPGGVLLPESGFFEFVPVGADLDEARPGWELERGRQYRILITTHGGLYRYDLEDVVRVEGAYCDMPVLAFLHRAGRVYSFTGEKLTEYQVTHAVRAAADASGVHLAGFTAVPVWAQPPYGSPVGTSPAGWTPS